MNTVNLLCVFVIGVASTLNGANSSIYEGGLNDWEKQFVTNKHNELRNLISEGKVPGQPRGTNLKQLKYDENLGREAQQISDSCKFAHKAVHDGRWSVGQNLYATYSTDFQKGSDWNGAIQGWFDEYPNYHYGDTNTNGKNGHYTQVVWANTEYIGCGFTHCSGDGSWPYQKIYVCNYGPAKRAFPILTGQGVGDRDKQIIVKKHNDVRNLISQGKVRGQPKGKNLKTMKYDDKLAKEAQKISNTCKFAHVRVKDGRWQAVGQNLYTTYSTAYKKGADWDSAIQNWFNEYPYYKYGDRTTNNKNGHYTQVVWADTEYVGCGYTECKGTSWPFQKLYVCNYGPAGNYIGQLPYAT
ncbi:hypothetical protein NQ315_008568 [Exocentrus adspersus]|uniref:SCP domain-containing protein n=1 Tax=Exocentrus adspersus TaxID=1586481 RepID=A0AAV8W679_9CUCU|nr:hypothetical protein NQ315_008568 [Exocentrus adspersus]